MMFSSLTDNQTTSIGGAWRRPAILATVLGLWCLAFGASSAYADFGIQPESFNVTASNSADPANEWEANPADPATQAGAHPFITTVGFAFNESPKVNVFGQPIPYEDPRDTKALLPAGMVGDPTAATVCAEKDLENAGKCPSSSQVGTVEIKASQLGGVATFRSPLFNVTPEPGKPGELAFPFSTIITHISVSSNGSNGYRLESDTAELTQFVSLYEVHVNIWGVPGDPRHDAQRTLFCNAPFGGCSGGNVAFSGQVQPFFSLPTQCATSLPASLATDSWQQPGRFLTGSDELSPMTGCDKVPFEPSAEVRPKEPRTAAPSAFTIGLNVPQSDNPEGLATSHVKDVTMSLPKGVAISPSAANGLGACTDAQIGVGSDDPVSCPDSAKLGTVQIDTPVLAEPLNGFLYLGTQQSNDPESGQMFRLFLVASGSGVTVKLPGQVKADPATGQLSTYFLDNPQLPFEKLHIELFGGSGAALVDPPGCGTYTTNATLTSWSGKTVKSDSTFTVSADGNGAPCPGPRFSPGFDAGTANPVAGAYTPFTLHLQRSDGDQEFSSLRSLTLPPGLSASLRGTTYCSDSALAAANTAANPGHTGADELASPSCPGSSLIGSATVGAGPGSNPFYANSGKVYLAGPYKGAPLSIAVSVPAVAGPFDLGNVVVRSALYVDPTDASLEAVSDPFPTILGGIPLQVRDIQLNIDRSHFTVNPTSCTPMSVDGTAVSSGNMSAHLHSRFQVGECAALGLKPSLALKFSGAPTRRGGHPKLTATLKTGKNEANLRRVQVTLPKTEYLENAHIRTVCTRVQYAANQCPKKSVYGYARAWTPLLDKPLEGPVYLRSSSHKLPDLVASLDGQIHIDLAGRISSSHARIRNTFETVPDAPVEKFMLTMQGGGKGLLVNNTNLCKAKPRATVKFNGQNGKVAETKPLVQVGGCGKGGKKGKKKK
jgi:hypothetical protein